MPTVGDKIATGAALGAGVVLIGGLLAFAAIPSAMAAFGAVVAGTGTVHATTAVGGVAANLQVRMHGSIE